MYVPLIFPAHLECCGKYPKMKPDRWLRRLDSHGSKPRPNPTPMSPLYSIYVSRRSKSRCTPSAPPMQVAQLQMVPRTRRRHRIRVIASLCERKSSVTTPRSTIPCALTRSPFVPPYPIPLNRSVPPGFIAPNFFLFVPFVQPVCAPLAGYPAYGPARIFAGCCKSSALSPAGTILTLWALDPVLTFV